MQEPKIYEDDPHSQDEIDRWNTMSIDTDCKDVNQTLTVICPQCGTACWKPTISTDIPANLAAMEHQLEAMIAQEQDDALNGLFCDLRDSVDAIRVEYEKKAQDEFQSDVPPNAPKVPKG